MSILQPSGVRTCTKIPRDFFTLLFSSSSDRPHSGERPKSLNAPFLQKLPAPDPELSLHRTHGFGSSPKLLNVRYVSKQNTTVWVPCSHPRHMCSMQWAAGSVVRTAVRYRVYEGGCVLVYGMSSDSATCHASGALSVCHVMASAFARACVESSRNSTACGNSTDGLLRRPHAAVCATCQGARVSWLGAKLVRVVHRYACNTALATVAIYAVSPAVRSSSPRPRRRSAPASIMPSEVSCSAAHRPAPRHPG